MFPSSSGGDGSGSGRVHPDKSITLHRYIFDQFKPDKKDEYEDEKKDQHQGQGEDEAGQQQPKQPDRREDQQQRRPSPSSTLARNPVHIPAQEQKGKQHGTTPSQTSAVGHGPSNPEHAASMAAFEALSDKLRSATRQGGKDAAAAGGGGVVPGSSSGHRKVGGDFTKNNSRSNRKKYKGKANYTGGRGRGNGNGNDKPDGKSSKSGSGNKARGADDDGNVSSDDQDDEEARAAKANEAARILCASCYAGAKMAKIRGLKPNMKPRKEHAERKHRTWTAGDVLAAEQEQQKGKEWQITFEKFMDIVDPYPRQLWNVWDKKVPNNLQVYSFGQQWRDGPGEKKGEGPGEKRGDEPGDNGGDGSGEDRGDGSGEDRGEGTGQFSWRKLAKRSFRSLRSASRRGERSSREASATENTSPRASGEVFDQPVYGNKSSLDNPKGDSWHGGSGSQHAAGPQQQQSRRRDVAPWTTPPQSQDAFQAGNLGVRSGGTQWVRGAVPNFSRKRTMAGPASKVPVSGAQQPGQGVSPESGAKYGEEGSGHTNGSWLKRIILKKKSIDLDLVPRGKGKGKAVGPPSGYGPSAEAGPSQSQGMPPASTSTSQRLSSRPPSPVCNQPPAKSQGRHELNYHTRPRFSEALRQNTSATASQASNSQEPRSSSPAAAAQSGAARETAGETQGGTQGEAQGEAQGESAQDGASVGGLDGSDARRSRRERLRELGRRMFGRSRKDKAP